MRPLAVPLLFLAAFGIVGCTSGSDTADLMPIPGEASKTSRLAASAAMPPAPLGGQMPTASVGAMAPPASTAAVISLAPPAAVARAVSAPTPPQQAERMPAQAMLAWEGPGTATHAFDAMTTTVGMPVPAERPVAALSVPMPSVTPRGTLNPLERRGPAERMEIYSHRFRDAKPINFGRSSPKRLAVHGVDVSRWQGDIDWATLRSQGANFAYIKATDGGDHIDPMFKTNWKKARDAGMKHGAYHFFYWCRTAGEQADWFIRNVPREPGALPPVIDVEYNGESSCKVRLSRAKVLEKIKVFADRLERHYGQRPIIYTAPDFYKDNLEGEMLEYPFWLRSVAAHPTKVYPGRKWLFWQYSGSGLSQGVQGKIDLNVFNGSENDWHGWVASAN